MPAHCGFSTAGRAHFFIRRAMDSPKLPPSELLFTVTVRPRTVFWSAPDAGQILRYTLCFAAAFGTMKKKGDDGR